MANTNEPEQRSTVDWRARQRRQRIAAVAKMLFVAALLGVVVGLGILYYPTLRTYLTPAQQSQTPPPPPPKKVVTAKPPKTEKAIEAPKEEPKQVVAAPEKAPLKPAEPEVVGAEEQRAKQLIEQGRLAMLKTDFAGARKVLDEAVQLRATRETHVAAQKLGYQAEQFDLATSHVKVSDFAKAERTWVIELREGRTMRGLLEDEQQDMIVLSRISDDNPAATGRIKAPIPRVQIQSKREVSLAERQKEFYALLGQLESSLSVGADAKATDYYDLVVLSRRLGLNDKCLEYLEAAYQKAPDQALGTLFRKLIIDRALERATLLAAAGKKIQAESVLRELTARTLPGYGKAADAADAFRVEVLSKISDDFRSTIALKSRSEDGEATNAKARSAKQLASAATTNEGGGADVEIVVVHEGITSSNPKATQYIQQGNKFYEEGMTEYKKYRQGTQGSNNAVLKSAMVKLEKAVDLYGQALDIDKNNKAISDRQVEANMIVYACKKYQTL